LSTLRRITDISFLPARLQRIPYYYSRPRARKSTRRLQVFDNLARESSAIDGGCAFIDDERTDADDGCTDIADGGTFPRGPCTKSVFVGRFLFANVQDF